MEEKIPEILYHYCSVDTFIKIIQNKTLRLSEITKSNDSMECRWLEKAVIPEMLGSICDNLCKRKKFDDSEQERITSNYTRAIAERELNRYFEGNEGLINRKLVLATSFSQKRDLLSQWRGYADDGYGVAIGFNTDIFKPYISQSEMAPCNFKKVIYNRRMQESKVRRNLKNYLRKLIDDPKNQKTTILQDLIFRMLESSIFIKNPAFVEEAEWRFYIAIYFVNDYSELKQAIDMLKINDMLQELNVSTRSNKAIFYSDIKFETIDINKDKQPWLKEIVIGPKCKLSERDVRLLLGRYDWDTVGLAINKSIATYI
ncbi:MAG: DUF2971 domain-containing protein [Clostridiales bacterium]|nr:DUF2971 domain-containing protein [Clostridiales bacterium]